MGRTNPEIRKESLPDEEGLQCSHCRWPMGPGTQAFVLIADPTKHYCSTVCRRYDRQKEEAEWRLRSAT